MHPPIFFALVSRTLLDLSEGCRRSVTVRHPGQAYRRLLCVRPGVDPLPPYRRGLCALEAELCEAGRHAELSGRHVGLDQKVLEMGIPLGKPSENMTFTFTTK